MAKTFTINGIDYSFPEQGGQPPWGSDVTDWAEAVTDTLDTLSAPNDILSSFFSLANNQTSAASVVGFSFSNAAVRSFVAEYSIFRSTTTPSTAVETGVLKATFDGSQWVSTQEYNGNSGVTLSVASTGQVQYTSTNMTGGSPTGTIKFRALTFAQ
jgi:hypothetical protein